MIAAPLFSGQHYWQYPRQSINQTDHQQRNNEEIVHQNAAVHSAIETNERKSHFQEHGWTERFITLSEASQRGKAKDDIQGESTDSSSEPIHKLRQTHRYRNTSLRFFFLRLGKGNNKRLGLTETQYLLSERQLKWTYWIAQGSLLNTLKEPIWEKTPKKRRIDVPLCITESSSCQPKTNTTEVNSTSLENKS